MISIPVPQIRGHIEHCADLASMTTWRIGGKADVLFEPESIDAAAEFLHQLESGVEVFWLGLGSNILIRDGGIRGVVISTQKGLSALQRLDGNRVYVEAGVPCPKLAKFTAREAMSGGEWFCGIPGTIGGALAMNAGAFGGETWDLVTRVQTLSATGELTWRTPDEFQIQYRKVLPRNRDEWFVAAEFEFEEGDSAESQSLIKRLLKQRTASQPMGENSCGSVFKNPVNDFAGRLVESCGLKGYAVGGAKISEKHANFIVNANNASAQDIESLIAYAQKIVAEKTGVKLETEVRIVGEALS